MKAFMIFAGLAVCSMFLISGCGSGSAGVTGTLNVTAANVSSTDTTSKVAFTITYTHPTASSVGGLRYNYSLYINGELASGPVEEQMNDNGTGSFTKILSFDILKASVPLTVRLVATTDNLTSSDSVTVTALDVLEILPTTQTFLTTDLISATKTFSISGGVPPYVITVQQSTTDPLVSFVTTVDSVTLTRASAAAGTVTITVKDSSDPVTPTQVQAQAILQAIP